MSDAACPLQDNRAMSFLSTIWLANGLWQGPQFMLRQLDEPTPCGKERPIEIAVARRRQQARALGGLSLPVKAFPGPGRPPGAPGDLQHNGVPLSAAFHQPASTRLRGSLGIAALTARLLSTV